MASLAAIFGSGAMTNSLSEIPGMEVLLIIGSNTKETHPVIANKMIQAARRGAKIIIADPRRIPMVKFSELFLNLKHGTDVALLNGLAHVIVSEGLFDKDFIAARTEGFEEYKKFLADFTPEKTEAVTGVPREDIIRAARIYASSKKAGIFYTMGITQHTHGTDNVSAVANLSLLTGNVGRENTGVNPLRGQNNVQGACDAGALPDVLPGYQKVAIPEVRAKFEKAWGATLPATTGLMATEMIPLAAEGKVKALYIMGENPVVSDPYAAHTLHALQSLEFLVVQDIFLTETAQLADVVLPAACFAEKDGTFTNTERRVQLVRKAVEPPGEAKEDWRIVAALSNAFGYPMNYASAGEIFEEFASLWPALAGMTYERLAPRGLQWPCPTPKHPGTRFLHKDAFPRGRAPFTQVPYRPSLEPVDNAYPLLLSTGRNLFQYHTGSMTRKVEAIEAHSGAPYVEMSPADAASLGIREGQTVKVTSRRGSITLKARLTRRVGKGTVFIPMHWAEAAANTLTIDALDPQAKTPEFKVAAVNVQAA